MAEALTKLCIDFNFTAMRALFTMLKGNIQEYTNSALIYTTHVAQEAMPNTTNSF